MSGISKIAEEVETFAAQQERTMNNLVKVKKQQKNEDTKSMDGDQSGHGLGFFSNTEEASDVSRAELAAKTLAQTKQVAAQVTNKLNYKESKTLSMGMGSSGMSTSTSEESKSKGAVSSTSTEGKQNLGK